MARSPVTTASRKLGHSSIPKHDAIPASNQRCGRLLARWCAVLDRDLPEKGECSQKFSRSSHD